MGYSIKDSDVRVDLFKDSGCWDGSIVLDMDHLDYKNEFTDDAVSNALLRKYPDADKRFKGMILICLEPHHIRPYPVMIKF